MRDPSTAAAGVWDASRRPLTLGLLLTVSSTAFEALAVATVLPAAVDEIGGLSLYGWAFSMFMLTNLLGISIAGGIVDERGPALPFVAGTALFACGLLLAGVAPSMPIVVAGRAAQGLGAGAISSVAYVAIARAYPASAQPHMLALLSSAWVVPGLIGPAIAAAVADHFHWRWVFLGLAPLAMIAAGLAVPALRRLAPSPGAAPAENRTPAALRLALGTGLVLFGVDAGALPLDVAFVVAGLALGLPALRRLTPAGTLGARPGLPAAVATMGLLSFAFFGAEAFLPLALTAVRGQSTMIAGVALTAGTLAWTAGAWLQARLARRRSRRHLGSVGLLLTSVGIAGIASALFAGTPLAVAMIAWGFAGLGIGIAYSTITLTVLESAEAGSEGEASASMQLASVLGVAIGTGLGGSAFAVLSSHLSPAAGIAAVDAIALAGALLGLVTARRLPATRPEREA